jgi:hemolysin D
LQWLTAPIDGVVQQLAVHTVGGAVTPAQALLVVVATDSPLEIEAMVTNRDVGFVHAGQDAEIKVDTFNFTRSALLHSHVLSLSQDAIARQTSGQRWIRKRILQVPPAQFSKELLIARDDQIFGGSR